MPENSTVTAYDSRILALHMELRIPRDYSRRGLPKQPDCDDLVSVTGGSEGAPTQLATVAAGRWEQLREAARQDGFILSISSGYRSPEDQAAQIKRELAHGIEISRILSRFLAPGYSEHHTGCALDIVVPDCPFPLPELYEATPGFEWLQGRAKEFGFSLSYPRGNPYGIIYEPWHWKCSPQ